jgi:glycosyltransferase involved in cell wall biosynthesis
MRAALDGRVRWEPGGRPLESLRSLRGLGRWDICHAHMTAAEALAVATRPVHKAPVVSTRHFAARRGASPAGRVAAPWIAAGITREIAIGEFVAEHLERRPEAVIALGVPQSRSLWRPANRVVLLLQRLEAEKDTATALRAWHAAELDGDGWHLRVCGEGSERGELERLVEAEGIRGVTFAGWTDDVAKELEDAGVLLASALAEPLGLSVLDAMAAGVPVVASASGGHLETAGSVDGAVMFEPGDPSAAAGALQSVVPDAVRSRLSAAGRKVVAERFTLDGHVDRLLAEYETARADRVHTGLRRMARRFA